MLKSWAIANSNTRFVGLIRRDESLSLSIQLRVSKFSLHPPRDVGKAILCKVDSVVQKLTLC